MNTVRLDGVGGGADQDSKSPTQYFSFCYLVIGNKYQTVSADFNGLWDGQTSDWASECGLWDEAHLTNRVDWWTDAGTLKNGFPPNHNIIISELFLYHHPPSQSTVCQMWQKIKTNNEQLKKSGLQSSGTSADFLYRNKSWCNESFSNACCKEPEER